MNDVRPVVVVGGGAGGALVSIQLLAAGWPVVLVDPGAAPGRGVAHAVADAVAVADDTATPWHLLNSPVEAMTALPGRPDDFLRWCRMRCPGTQPSSFVPRGWFAQYLSETLRQNDSELTVHRATVARIFDGAGGGFTVLLADGVVIPAGHVVLALGNAAPADPLPLSAEVRRSPAYLADPWEADPWEANPWGGIPPVVGDGPVLLIGTGLTAYDVALSLVRTNPGREIVAVSRHGMTPRSHRRTPAAARRAVPVTGGPLAQLLREFRRRVAETGDWQAVLDGYRPYWNDVWQGLSEPDQRRFLRHVARFWEVHRHRVAPAVADRIAELSAKGIFRVRAGEVCGLATDPSGLAATIRYRDGGVVTQRFSAVVNCTGPGHPVKTSPLVRSLVAEGIARPGRYRLGVDTDPHGALVRRDGSVNPALWTLGPPRRGVLWETTAVPEIRAQAQDLAQRLTSMATPKIAAGGRLRGSGLPTPSAR